MSIEFTHCPSLVSLADGTEAQSFFFDPQAAGRKLQAIEQAGFGKIVIDDFAGLLGNMDLAALAIGQTTSLGIALTHWAGIVEPVVAARQIAFLDRLSGGRLSLRVLTGAYDAEAHTHLGLHQRTDEYLVLLKRLWSNDVPIDHEGVSYSVVKGFVEKKSPRGAGIDFRMGGLSGTSLKIAGRHASVFELSPGSRDDVLRAIERVRAASADYGRSDKIRLSLPVAIASPGFASSTDETNAIRVSGTPSQIAGALLDYAELGVSEFAVHGLSSVETIETFGRTIIPGLRWAMKRLGRAENVSARAESEAFYRPM